MDARILILIKCNNSKEADALFAGDGVGAYVFQSAKVTLIGAVEDVLEREVEAADFPFAAFYICACFMFWVPKVVFF